MTTHHNNDIPRMLSTAYALIEREPPPSLKDIVGAYRSKGDGDRDLLIAMLNAKSAEDQRLANVAALQRSVLDLYTAHPERRPESYYPIPSTSRHVHHEQPYSHMRHQHADGHAVEHARSPYSRSRRSMSPHPYHEPSRKRHRGPSPLHSPQLSGPGLPSAALPPSPYSSHSSVDSNPGPGDSPRSGGSMAINSLLRAGQEWNRSKGDSKRRPSASPEIVERPPPTARRVVMA